MLFLAAPSPFCCFVSRDKLGEQVTLDWCKLGMVRARGVRARVWLLVVGSGRARASPNSPSRAYCKRTTVLYTSRDTPYWSGHCQALSHSRPPADLTRSRVLCRPRTLSHQIWLLPWHKHKRLSAQNSRMLVVWGSKVTQKLVHESGLRV